MSARTIPVTMPDWLWGRLVTIADHRGMKVADLVADALLDIVHAEPRVRPVRYLDEGSFADTGAPGHRADRLAAEVREFHRAHRRKGIVA